MTRVLNDMMWFPIEDNDRSHYLRVGGSLPEGILPSHKWPHFEDSPLPYFGTVQVDNVTVHLFLNTEADESWQVEEGANCALVEGEDFPEWVTLKDLHDHSQLRFADNAYATDDHLDEPQWLQGDESPENDELGGYNFIGQVPSQVDGHGGQEIVIADYGTAYIFLGEGETRARMLWQC